MQKIRTLLHHKASVVSLLFLLFWATYFLYFWSHAIFFDAAGNMITTHVSIWGDWAAHFTMGSAMAYKNLLLETSPFLIGAPFSYPFVANMISAVLIIQGVSFFPAFIVPSAIASIMLIGILFLFYKRVFKSHFTAVVATTLYLCNGGLGFLQFIADIASSPMPLTVLLNPPQEYTHLSNWNIEWISVINSMIIPQRAFTLGFPIAIFILLLLYKVFFSEKKLIQKKYILLIIAGLLTGSLTLIHSHSLLALSIIIPCWGMATLIENRNTASIIKQWTIWLVAAGVIALPLISMFLSKNIDNNFFSWYPGWFAKEHSINWFIFWFNNWGVVPLLSIIGYAFIIKSEKKMEKRQSKILFFLPFFILFFSLNLFLFQPFIWDNTKLLAWASVGISGLAAYALHRFLIYGEMYWQRSRLSGFLTIMTACILFCVSIASGAVDAYRVIRFDLHTYEMYSKEELRLAEWVKINTNEHSVWLTGDQHNNWMYNLTGRQSLMTFRGWLWTHGYDYLEVESDTSSLLMQPTAKLIQEYNISYALIGDNERREWHANEQAFIQQFPIVMQTPHYIIFDLRQRIN